MNRQTTRITVRRAAFLTLTESLMPLSPSAALQRSSREQQSTDHKEQRAEQRAEGRSYRQHVFSPQPAPVRCAPKGRRGHLLKCRSRRRMSKKNRPPAILCRLLSSLLRHISYASDFSHDLCLIYLMYSYLMHGRVMLTCILLHWLARPPRLKADTRRKEGQARHSGSDQPNKIDY